MKTIVAYDADGNVMATLDVIAVRDADGHVIGVADVEAHATEGRLRDVWDVDGAVRSAIAGEGEVY